MFDDAAEYVLLYPDHAPQPVRFCAPRAEDGFELEHIRATIAARCERAAA